MPDSVCPQDDRGHCGPLLSRHRSAYVQANAASISGESETIFRMQKINDRNLYPLYEYLRLSGVGRFSWNGHRFIQRGRLGTCRPEGQERRHESLWRPAVRLCQLRGQQGQPPDQCRPPVHRRGGGHRTLGRPVSAQRSRCRFRGCGLCRIARGHPVELQGWRCHLRRQGKPGQSEVLLGRIERPAGPTTTTAASARSRGSTSGCNPCARWISRADHPTIPSPPAGWSMPTRLP